MKPVYPLHQFEDFTKQEYHFKYIIVLKWGKSQNYTKICTVHKTFSMN
jgi:hypothetical protein